MNHEAEKNSRNRNKKINNFLLILVKYNSFLNIEGFVHLFRFI
jgi:hypothetical protein